MPVTYTDTTKQQVYDGSNVAAVTDAIATPKYTVTLPEKTDVDALTDLMESLNDVTEVKGSVTLATRISKYILHINLCEQWWDKVEVGASFINGVRTTRQSTGYKKRSIRATAKEFFESLTPAMLTLQCQALNVDASMYNGSGEIIEALVTEFLKSITPESV